jgi:hypothetical protein
MLDFPEFPSAVWKPFFEEHGLAFRFIAEFKEKFDQPMNARRAVVFPPPALHGVGNQEVLDALGRLSFKALTAGQKKPRREDKVT